MERSEMFVACAEFLGTASDFYNVPPCPIRVLATRPLRVREYSTTELFGDYHPSTMLAHRCRETESALLSAIFLQAFL
jgi:hypothetical protein